MGDSDQGHLEVILAAIDDVIYISDPETYELVYANASARRTWGEGVVGRKCYEALQNRTEPCPFCTNPIIFDEKPGEVHVWEFQNEVNQHWYRCSDRTIDWTDGRKLRFELAVDITELKTAQARAEIEQAFTNSVIDALPGLFYVISPNGRFQRWNKRFETVSGYNHEEMAEISPLDLFRDDERALVGSRIEKAFATGYSAVEANLIDKSGRQHPYFFTGARAEVEGEMLLFGLGTDISDRRRIEAEMGRIFNMSLDMICIADLSTNTFTRVNPAFTHILGYSEEELVGQPFLSFNHPDDVQPTIDVVEEQLKQGSKVVNFENRYRCKDGSYRWLSWVSHPDADTGVTYAVARDVTERRRSEVAIQEANRELARSNKELEQFAYVASHDLQEPLRMVASYTQLLERRYSDQLDKSAKEFIQYAVDGANRMQRLINDLLMYSRVSTQGKPPEVVDPHTILAQTIVNLGLLIEENGAIVTNADLPEVHADPGQLSQLFQNLLTNAIKFRGDGAPRIHIGAEERDDWIEFSVRDNGIGIEEQHTERIFVLFQRLHGREEYAGTGIGLAVCKRIVERHGGRIWVESQPGEGTTFLFTLPKANHG